MRVLHVITRLIQGGAQQNTVISCAAQVRAGHEVHLAYGPIYGPEGSLLEEARASGAVLHELSSMRRAVLPWHDYAIYRQLRSLMLEVRPDLVHTHSSKAGIVGRAAAWGTRRFAARTSLSGGVGEEQFQLPVVVHTVHGLPFHDGQRALVRSLYVSLERWAAKRCDHLIAITPAMVEAFTREKIAGPERFTVIPSGVELSRFDATLDRAQAKRSFGLPADAPVVGLIARLDPLKGHRDLLRAFPMIAEKVPGARVLFVGDGFDAPKIRAAAAAIPGAERVVFAGYVPFEGMSRAYRACDVVALPSYQEGQSRVLVEALWCGCAVTAYDAGGISSVCVDQETGLLVPLGDVAGLGEAVASLLNDPSKSAALVARGRRHVAERFSAEHMNRELLALYARLVG